MSNMGSGPASPDDTFVELAGRMADATRRSHDQDRDQLSDYLVHLTDEAVNRTAAGRRLAMIPARLESFAEFRARAPHGTVLVGDHGRPYGNTPYVGYDSTARPFLYNGPLPEGIAALARVVRVGTEAWSLDLLRREGEVVAGDLRLAWSPGQASALDSPEIARGADVGSVTVQRQDTTGGWRDIPYSVDFAFAFHAFYSDATIHK